MFHLRSPGGRLDFIEYKHCSTRVADTLISCEKICWKMIFLYFPEWKGLILKKHHPATATGCSELVEHCSVLSRLPPGDILPTGFASNGKKSPCKPNPLKRPMGCHSSRSNKGLLYFIAQFTINSTCTNWTVSGLKIIEWTYSIFKNFTIKSKHFKATNFKNTVYFFTLWYMINQMFLLSILRVRVFIYEVVAMAA